jgi:hypothetical protein
MATDNSNFSLSPYISFPSQLDSFEVKKTKEWGCELAQAIESEWFYGLGVNTYGVLNSRFNTQRYDFIQRRMYAKGIQSMDKYLDQQKPNGDKSFLNLPTKPISVIPKNVDILVNTLCDRGYYIKAVSTDPIGISERVAYREQIETDRNAKDVIIKAKETFGVDIASMPIENIPETEAEIDLHMELEYKQDVEISQELAIESIFNENYYNEITDRQQKQDMVICGVGWLKNTFVPERGIVLEYVDCENKIQSYTEDPYFRDCFYHGEFKNVPLSQIFIDYQWVNLPGNEKIKEQITNSSDAWWNYNVIAENQRIKGTANLLYFTYKTTRKRAKKIKQKATGERIVSSAAEFFDEKSVPNLDFKRVEIEEEILFEGVYLLGTNILLKWEVAENMARPKSNKQKVVDQYIGMAPNMEKGYIDSHVARMIPIEDKIEVIELKVDQIIQPMMADGFIIDPDAISELDFGGGNKFNAQNVMDMFWQTGSIFARSFSASGDPMYSKAITELRTGGSLEKLQALVNRKMELLTQIDDVVGLNKASNASTPDKESLLGVNKLASKNTSLSIRHILKGACNNTLRLAEAVTYRIPDLLKYSDLKNDFERKIGVASIKALDSVKNLHLHDFSIFLELELDDEERAKLEQDMSDAIAKGQMSVADKYKVLNVKNLKLALQYMTVLMDKHQAKIQEQEMAKIQANTQSQTQIAQAAEKARQQTMQMELQGKGQLQQLINQGELQKEQLRGDNELRNIQTKLRGEFQIAQVQGGVQMDKLQFLEEKKDERLVKQATMDSEKIEQRKKENAEPIDFEAKEIDESMFEV